MSTIDEIEREIAKVKLLNDMSDGITAPRSTRVLELAAIEITSANARIRVLTDGEALMRRNAHDWKEAYNAEREVADKLEKALEFYANGGHSVYLYGVLVDWKAERSRLEASGFSCVGEGYNGGETYMEDGTTASSALAEVAAIRKRRASDDE